MHPRRHKLGPITLAVFACAAAAPARAQTTGGGAATLQEVVITSQKRVERIKDAAVAASVVGELELERQNVSDIVDINKLVPSVQLKGTFNGRVPLAIRGISTSANEAAIGLTSGVAILIDGVPVPADSFSANELQDIARIEVLKGPQSTLGGRAASAGVINLVTLAPGKTFSGSAGLTLTNDGERRVNGFVSGPIGGMMGFSASLYRNQREYPIHNLATGENSESTNSGFRGKLLLSPTKDLDLTLTARSARADSTGETFTYQYLTPGVALFPYFPFAPNGIAQSASFPGVNIRYGNPDYNSPVPMSAKVRGDDVSLNIEQRFGGGYTFSSITAHQKEKSTNVQDVTAQAVYFLNVLRTPFIPLPPAGPPLWFNDQNITIRPKSLTQEFKIASPLAAPVSYVAGLFYSDVKTTQEHERNMFVNVKNDSTSATAKSLALYGRATWNLSPAASLLTGLRWNRDRIDYRIDTFDLGRQPVFSSSGTDTANATVGDLTLRYKLDRDNMVYATLARGYKPRAFNTAATLAGNAALAPVDREDIDHFEAGAKNSFGGGALSTSLAVFDTTYKNYQVQFYPPGQIVPSLELANAGKARTRGVELDTTIAATASTKLTLNAAYIDAKFVEFKNAPAWPGQTTAQGAVIAGRDAGGAPVFQQDLSGKTMPDAPKIKLSAGIEQRLAAGGLLPWETTLSATYAYRSKALMQGNQNPNTLQPAFGILNLGATASSPSGKYAITGFVNNALNRFYLVNAEDFFSGLYAAPGTFAPGNAVIGQPARDARRYVGLRLNVYFD